MDYEYLKWGHKKIPLLRHLRQVTFHRPPISGYDIVVSPESTISEATFASVGYAIQVLSHLLFTKTTRSHPNGRKTLRPISLTPVSQMNSTLVRLILRIWKMIITTSMGGTTNWMQVMILEGSMMTGLACPVI